MKCHTLDTKKYEKTFTIVISLTIFSTRITSPGVSDDRLVNASQNNLRSYVTVNRPAPAPGQVRPSTFSSKSLFQNKLFYELKVNFGCM